MSDTTRFEVRVLRNGRYVVSSDGTTQLAYAVSTPSGTWVFLEGQTFLITSDINVVSRHHSDDQMALSAPMPASVIAVNVTEGQRVQAGDVMLLLEAMKMELPISAPRDAIVKRIACQAGELVQPGEPLIELED